MATDFPIKGEDKKISLRNSNYDRFDLEFAKNIEEFNPEIWELGGNIRGNDAWELGLMAREGNESPEVLAWIKEREAWSARHFEDGSQFLDGNLEPVKSNVAGVVAQMKWHTVGVLGEQRMKDVVLELIKKLEGKKDDERAFGDLSDAVQTGIRNMVNEHNEEVGDDETKRTNVRTLAQVFERGIGAFKTSPASVRPGVTSPEQWAYARCRSFLFVLRNGRFQGGKHDTDLLPLGHPLSTKERDMEVIEQRHIKKIEETENEIVVHFWKGGMGHDYEGIETMPEMETSGAHLDEEEDMETNMAHSDDEKEEKGSHLEEERISKTELTFRAAHIDESHFDEKTRRVRMTISSEEPVERDFGREVISHRSEHMDLEFLNSGRAPLLFGHDTDKIIGVIETATLDEAERKVRIVARFSSSDFGSTVFNDVRDGIIKNVSVGYKITERVKDEDDPDDVVRVATQPLEASLVSLPADMSSEVGVARSLTFQNGDDKMEDFEKRVADAVAEQRKNDKEILDLASRHNKRDLGEKAISEGMNVDSFRAALLKEIENKPLDNNPSHLDAPEKEVRGFTIGGAIKDITENGRLTGLNAEIQQQLSRQHGKSVDANAFHVPGFAWRAGALSTAATGAVGDENVSDSFVQTTVMTDQFIEALRPHMVLQDLGATFMTGLTGRVQMPRFSAGANAAFVEELGDVADQSQTDAAVTLTPRTIGAFVDVSRLMSLEVPAIDQIVRNDLLASVANKIEEAAIQGSGSSGNPTGILNTSGINNLDVSAGTDVAALTWQDIIDLVKLVEEDNGVVNANALGFLTNAKVKSKLASTVRVASTDSVFLLNDPWDNMYGYPIAFTTNVPSNLNPGDGGTDGSALIFGDFSQLMIGTFFGGPVVEVDTAAGFLAGSRRIRILQEVDVAVRNPLSFAITDEVSTA